MCVCVPVGYLDTDNSEDGDIGSAGAGVAGHWKPADVGATIGAGPL